MAQPGLITDARFNPAVNRGANAQALTDMLVGQVHVAFFPAVVVQQHARSGRLRARTDRRRQASCDKGWRVQTRIAKAPCLMHKAQMATRNLLHYSFKGGRP